jgi:hypothetical protein
VGEIDDALERADAEAFTRQPPKTPLVQMRLSVKAEKGSTKAVTGRLSVSQRTVERGFSRVSVSGLVRSLRPRWLARLPACGSPRCGSRLARGPGTVTLAGRVG